MKKSLMRLALSALAVSFAPSVVAFNEAEMSYRLLNNMESIGRLMQQANQCRLKPQELPGTSSAQAESYRFARISGVASKAQLDAAYAYGVQRVKKETGGSSSFLQCWNLRRSVGSLDSKQADIGTAIKNLASAR